MDPLGYSPFYFQLYLRSFSLGMSYCEITRIIKRRHPQITPLSLTLSLLVEIELFRVILIICDYNLIFSSYTEIIH